MAVKFKMGSLLIIESNGTGPFYNGQTTSFTITGLPTQMSFDLLVYGTVTGNSAGNNYHNYPDDSITMTGPLFPAQTCEVPSPDFVIDGMVADLNGLTSAQFNLNGTLDSGDSWSITSATMRAFLGSPSIPDSSVVIGGESAIPVHFSSAKFDVKANGYSSVLLTVSGVDTTLVQPLSSVVTLDAAGDGTLFVKGTKVGTSPITITDAVGDYCTASIGVTAPQVSSSVNSETQGASYGPDDTIPGFWFTCGPSLTDVPVNYNTEGSTLPASLMGAIAGGTVTIPASPDGGSKFIPMEVAEDNKIAPSRWALVTLVVPGEDPGGSAKIRVDNTDVPTVKINGATSGALIKVDPEGVDGKLADIQLIIPDADQNIVTTTLSWSPELRIWLTGHVGALGTDLGSKAGGGYSYTWQGKGPTDVYAQAMGGSSNWNSTNVSLTVHVSKPATPAFAEATRDPNNSASGTANGLVISPGGSLQAPSNVLIGQRMNLAASWAGPGAPQDNSQIQWNVGGKVMKEFFLSADKSIGDPVPLTITAFPYANDTISFIWYAASNSGELETVTCSGAGSTASAFYDLYSPTVQVNVLHGDHPGHTTSSQSNYDFSSGVGSISLGTVDGSMGAISGEAGVEFSAFANKPLDNSGQYAWEQVITNLTVTPYKRNLFGTPYGTFTSSGSDGPFAYPSTPNSHSNDNVNAGGVSLQEVAETVDSPAFTYPYRSSFGSYALSATMWLMYHPSGGSDQDYVPVEKVEWSWQGSWQVADDIFSATFVTNIPSSGVATSDYPRWIDIAPLPVFS
jgi:hypothetical protein